jgi:hypothetical protein
MICRCRFVTLHLTIYFSCPLLKFVGATKGNYHVTVLPTAFTQPYNIKDTFKFKLNNTCLTKIFMIQLSVGLVRGGAVG